MSAPARMSRGDYLCALGAVVIWGLNFVVMKVGLQGLSPMMLGAMRFAAASLPFLPFVPRPSVPWRFVVIYGLVQGVGQFGLLFTGLKLGMTAGVASVVMPTQSFFTMILAVALLGEHTRIQQWLGVLVAGFGLALIGSAHGEGPGQMTLIGFVLTLGAAVMWAITNVVVRFAGRVAVDYDPFAFIIWTSIVPVVPFLALAAATEGPDHAWRSVSQISARDGLAVLYLGLLATLLAYTLWTWLLKRHPASRVAPFALLGPIVGLWAAWAAFGEQLSTAQWIGASAVLLGLVINQLGLRQPSRTSDGSARGLHRDRPS
jgi:O-acetylserine/cysteine efflux transporter